MANFPPVSIGTATKPGIIKSVRISADGKIVLSSPSLEVKSTGITDIASWSAHSQLLSGAAGTSSSVFWAWVIKGERFANPIAKYYMYYATDHGVGGIKLATSNSLTSGWVVYGQVYDDTSGISTETPSVVWDNLFNRYILYYQCQTAKYGAGNAFIAKGAQSTLAATSTDGITWTKDPNFILDIPYLSTQAGDGHTGYLLPFKTKRGLFAYSLYGGTNSNTMVLWNCKDRLGGRNYSGTSVNDWYSDRIGLGYGLEVTQDGELAGRAINWLSSFVVEADGTEYLVGIISDLVSGTTAKNGVIAVTPIAANYKGLLGRPTIIWRPTEAWESVDIRSVTPFVEDGILYVLYTTQAGTTFSIGVTSHAL